MLQMLKRCRRRSVTTYRGKFYHISQITGITDPTRISRSTQWATQIDPSEAFDLTKKRIKRLTSIILISNYEAPF